jgi:hypothetical protein
MLFSAYLALAWGHDHGRERDDAAERPPRDCFSS